MNEAKISSLEEKQKNFGKWVNNFVYDIYYRYSVEENRADLFKILAKEIILSPLYMKVTKRIIKNVDQKRHQILFRMKLQNLLLKNTNGKYNDPSELIDLSSSFNILSSKIFFF